MNESNSRRSWQTETNLMSLGLARHGYVCAAVLRVHVVQRSNIQCRKWSAVNQRVKKQGGQEYAVFST